MDRLADSGMDTSDLLLAVVGSPERVIQGRTAFQKTVYFVSVCLHHPLGYRPHLYGPYSPSVQRTINDLVATDFLREEQLSRSPTATQYLYTLTSDGAKAAAQLRREDSKHVRQIENIVTKCLDVSEGDATVLSWAAKTHFILTHVGSREAQSVVHLAAEGKSYGWEIRPEQVRRGAEVLFALDLATRHGKPS